MISFLYCKSAIYEVESVINPTWWRLLLPLAHMAGLYALSSVPADETDTAAGALLAWVTPQWQNLLHVPAYAALTLFWICAHSPRALSRIGVLDIATVLTLLWAVLDETHQTNVPGRHGSITDLLLDLAGAMLAVAFAWKMDFARATSTAH